MATLPELENALRKAHAAGNAEHARAFAAEIRRMRGTGGGGSSSTPDFSNVQADSRSTEEYAETDRKMVAQRAEDGINPTDSMGTIDRVRAGFGKSFVDTAEGVRQGITSGLGLGARGLGAQLSGMGMDGAARGLAQHVGVPLEQASQQQGQAIAQRRDRDAALMDTGAGFGGNIAGQVVQTLVPVGGAAVRATTAAGKLGRAATHGAAFAGAQPVVAGESRATNAALGGAFGAAGQGVASGLGRLAQRAKAAMPEAVQSSIDLARAAGIPLNVSQVTGSPALKAAVAASKWLPFSGAGGAAKKQQEAFNAAVGRSFGADATALTDDVMRAARKKIGDVFEGVYNRNNVPLTPADLRKLVTLETNAAKNLTRDEAQVLRNQMDRILDNADNGVLTGKKYQAVRTAMQAAESPDKIGAAVKAMRKELDEIAARAVGPEDAAKLQKSRGQWANLRVVEDALKQVGGAAGNIRPASLWPLIRKGSTKEMRELARIGQNVLKEGLGDSGTAQRTFYQNLLTGGAGGATVGGGAAALGVLPLLLKAAAGGAVAGRALNSNTASRALQQGRPTSALARLAQGVAPTLPIAAPVRAEKKNRRY